MGAACVFAVGLWLIVLSGYDIRYRRLPNVLTIPGAVVILVGAVIAGHGGWALLGALALGGLYLSVHLVSPRSMGAGDVKLAVGLGALTGAFGIDVWVLAALAAPLCTAAVLLAGAVVRGARSAAHGPAMCVASAAAVALGLVQR